MKKIVIYLFILFFPVSLFASYGDTTTFLGEVYSGDGELATEAYFDFPEDMCADQVGNFYIADTYNYVIRKIDTEGYVDTLAGTGSYGDTIGAASQAEFALPKGVACNSDGLVIVADSGNNKIKKILNGQVTTLVEGLNNPEGVHLKGSTVYFLDTDNNALKKVSVNGGTVTTVTSSLHSPKKIDILGDYGYVADSGSYKLLKVNLNNGDIETIAGNGEMGNRTSSCARTMFRNLWGVVVRNENEIFVSDGTGYESDTGEVGRGTGFLVKIDMTTGECLTSVFANDENMVSLNFPNGMDIYGDYVYVASTGIGVIYKYNLDDANDNEVFAGKSRYGEEYGADPLFGRPKNIIAHPIKKKVVYLIENNLLSKFNIKKKTATFVAGNVVDSYPTDDDKWLVGNNARFSDPRGMAFSKKGKWLYIADRNNNRVRIVNTKTKSVGYLTGAGIINSNGVEDNGYKEGKACPNELDADVKGCAYFNRPTGLALDKKKNVLYVSDTDNQVIRKIYLKGKRRGKTKLIAGSPDQAGFADGTGTGAKFHTPFSLALNKKGTILYVADRDNHAIRKIRLRDKKVTTIAGDGTAGYEDGLFENAKFSYPLNLTYKDRKLYVSEVGSQRIRLLDMQLGVVKLVSGSGERGYKDGSRKNTEFANPNGLVAKKNFLYIADDQNDVIRRINISGEAPYTDAAPTINSCVPSTLKYSDYPTGKAMINITGSNFRYGTKAYFGPYEVTTYVQSDASLAVEVPIGDMAYGYYEVKVMNNDGQYDKLIRCFSAQEYSGNVPIIDYWTD
jgi:sugar lactone lactonase YvrE